MKFDQLIEYNNEKYVSWKIVIKLDEEASPRPFYKKSKLNIYLGPPKYIKNEVLIICFYLIKNFFKKQKKVWNYST